MCCRAKRDVVLAPCAVLVAGVSGQDSCAEDHRRMSKKRAVEVSTRNHATKKPPPKRGGDPNKAPKQAEDHGEPDPGDTPKPLKNTRAKIVCKIQYEMGVGAVTLEGADRFF